MVATKQAAARFADSLLGKQALWPFSKGKERDELDRLRALPRRSEDDEFRRLARQMAQLAIAGRYWSGEDQEALMGAARARKLRLEPAPHEEEAFALAFPEAAADQREYGFWPTQFELWPDPYQRKRKWLTWIPAEEAHLDPVGLVRGQSVAELFERAMEKYRQSRRFDERKLLSQYLANVDLGSVAGSDEVIEVLRRFQEQSQERGRTDGDKDEEEAGKSGKGKGEKEKSRQKSAVEARSVPSELEEQFYPSQQLGKQLELFQTPDVAYRNIDRDAIRLLRRMFDRTEDSVPLDVYNEAVAMLPKYRKRRWFLTALLLGAGPLLGGLLGGPLGAAGGLAAGAGLSALAHLGQDYIPGLGPAWYLRRAKKLRDKLRKRLLKDLNRGAPLGMDPEPASDEILKRLRDLEERKYLDLARVGPGQLSHVLATDPALVQAAAEAAARNVDRELNVALLQVDPELIDKLVARYRG